MDITNGNEKPLRRNNHSNPKPQKDPELEAEQIYAKENGIEIPHVPDMKKNAESFEDNYSLFFKL